MEVGSAPRARLGECQPAACCLHHISPQAALWSSQLAACCLVLAPYLSRSWPAAARCTIYLQHQDYGQAEHYLDDLMHLMVRQWADAPGYLDCSATLADAAFLVQAGLLVLPAHLFWCFFSDILPVVVLTNLAGKQVRYYVTNLYPMVRYVLLTYMWYKFVSCGEIRGTNLYLVVRSMVQKPILAKSGQGMLVPVPGLRCGLVVGSIIFLTSASPALFLLLISSIIF